jgi:hypothetical protein
MTSVGNVEQDQHRMHSLVGQNLQKIVRIKFNVVKIKGSTIVTQKLKLGT